jgi:hypothetical protein
MHFPRIKRKKNKIEGNLIIDNPDIKVVTTTYEGKPFVIGIGTTEERTIEGEGAVDVKGGKGKYQSQKALKWSILYDPQVFPKMIPLENLKVIAASTIAVASGSKEALSAEFEQKNLKNIKETVIEDSFAEYLENAERLIKCKRGRLNLDKTETNAATEAKQRIEQIRKSVEQVLDELNEMNIEE